MEKYPEKLNESIDAMIYGEKFNDAIDMMLITKKYKEACNLLLKMDKIYFAVILAKMKLSQDEFRDVVSGIVKVLISNNNKKIKSAACFLISCHMFKEASNILYEGGYMFPSAVINAMKKDENGNIYFDSSKLVLN